MARRSFGFMVFACSCRERYESLEDYRTAVQDDSICGQSKLAVKYKESQGR